VAGLTALALLTTFASPAGATGGSGPTSTTTTTTTTVAPTAGTTPEPSGGSTVGEASTTSTAPTTTAGNGGSSTTSGPTTLPNVAPPQLTPTTLPGTPIDQLPLVQFGAQLLTQVQAEVGAAQAGLSAANVSFRKAQAADRMATTTMVRDAARLDELSGDQRQAADDVILQRTRVKDLAIAAYESGGPGSPVAALLSSETIDDYARAQHYFANITANGTDVLKDYVKATDSTSKATLTAVNVLQKAEQAKAIADEHVVLTTAAMAQAATLLASRQSLLTITSDAVSSPNVDIPRMVLDAYQRAAANVQARGCNLAWWGLAGIGRIESDHGRDEDAHLAPNGDLLPHIVGVPLTGADGTALIADASGGFAHAEGPMQFIPSTWAKWGADGNGDGVKSVDNIYDATLGAADYLCATSTALETDAGLEAAYMSYNHSADYVTEVLAWAHAYQAADADGLIPPMAAQPLYTLAPKPPAAPAPAAPGASTTTTTVPARRFVPSPTGPSTTTPTP